MRSRVLVPCLLLLWCYGSALAEDKAIGLQASGLATTSEGGQKWALVVGINEYSNVPTLRYARADARGLYEALIKAGFPADNIMLMTDTSTGHLYPTRGNLRARINQLATIVQKNDVLLVFFSGHGTEKNGVGYLVPIDGSTIDTSSLVPLSWIIETLETSPAKHRLLILDACHSGAKAGDAAASPAGAMLSGLTEAAFATLSSCDIDQLSYEDEQTSHGVFTSAIIEGLDGAADKFAQGNNDNIVNATELWAYAALKTKQWGIGHGKVQTPVLKGNFKGLIEIARYRSLEDLKAQREELSKKLAEMERLQRTSPAEELKKEIAKLEAQLASISSGVGEISGSDDVQLAYARYNAAKSQLGELQSLLAENLKTYQPGSRAITKIKERIDTAEVELQSTLGAKYQADAIMYESYQRQIDAKQAAYDDLTRELRPTAPVAKKMVTEISALRGKQQAYVEGYIEVNNLRTFTNSMGMKLIYIPPGEFLMGSPANEEGRYSDEGPQRRVKLSKGFYMGIYEVTQAQYRAIMGTNPSHFQGDNNPVECISWNDAMEFCRKLSSKEGRTYRLPTEAEWEYACRAGTQTRYSFGDSNLSLGDYALYEDNSSKKPHPVGQKKPNAFGLYDMHGNVLEWCNDFYSDSYANAGSTDPQGASSGQVRVLRGGCWYGNPRYCRSAYRFRNSPDNANYYGFRVVLSVSSLDF